MDCSRSACTGLEQKDFVRRERGATVSGETECAFRHLLVRDVAYGQIPRAGRAEKHRLAAGWIEALGRPEDHAEMLAYHYLAALELSRAAGLDITPLAVPAHRALREAGDRASALNAFEAAARFYGEALATAAMTEPELEFRHAQALFRSGNQNGMRALEEAREALATAGASERAAEADALLAEGWWYVAERDRCFDHLARAEEVVRDSVPSSAKARVLSQVARYRALAGDYEQAIEAAEGALAIADQLGLDEFRADALLNISLANAQRGHFVEAIAIARRAIEIALSMNSPVAARGLNNLGAHLARSGDEQEGLGAGRKQSASPSASGAR